MLILSGTPKAKADYWVDSDTEVRKNRERSGLDTHVFYSVNDVDYSFEKCHVHLFE